MDKIIVTGGSGFIGTNLIEYFDSQGADICNIDKVKPRNSKHNIFWKNINILDEKKLIDFFIKFQPTLIFHMAARTDLNGLNLEDYNENIDGVKNIVNAINSVDSINYAVFASSMLVCNLGYRPKNIYDYSPNTKYGESKVIGENIVRNAKLNIPWTIVRPTSIWGPWFDVPYKSFFDLIKRGLYLHPSGLRVRRSYGFVYNVVYQLDKLSKDKSRNFEQQTLYLADYAPIELSEWAQMISKSFNLSPVKEAPKFIFHILAFFGDFLKLFGIKNPPMTSFRLKNMFTESIFDISSLEENVGKCPYSEQEGVDITCQWILSQEAIKK